MTHDLFRQTLLASAMAASSTAMAQDVPESTAATPEACVAIETDATRLACYDRVLGRQARDTQAADAAAEQAAELARQDRKANAPEQRIRALELTALTMLQRLSEVADQID